MTNTDKIRNMTDEELELLLNKAVFCGGLIRSEQSSDECRGCEFPFCQAERYIVWLKRRIDTPGEDGYEKLSENKKH